MVDDAVKEVSSEEILQMTVDIVAAYVSNNTLSVAQVGEVISTVHTSLGGLVAGDAGSKADAQKPAVSVRRSVTPDYIICLEDGKKLKMLKRHLRAAYNLTPEEYRAKWNLPADYPMVAPNYAAQRSEFAKKIGLGRKPGQSPGFR